MGSTIVGFKWQTRFIVPFIFPFVLFLELNCRKSNELPDQLLNKKAQVYITAKDSDLRLSMTGSMPFTAYPQPVENEPVIMIDPNKTFQTIVGFGGALTDASAETFNKIPAEKQREVLQAYFDRQKGIGYSLCRLSIHSCDFSSKSISYAETPDDFHLEHFTIEQDRIYRIPLIRAAMKIASDTLRFFASPWSPPAWMKTNHNMLLGGKLKPECRQVWADYYIRFIESYKKEGIPIWGLTVQNEPMAVQTWESCIFSAEEERDFVRDFIGPTLVKNGLSHVKLMIWDHNRGIMYQRAKTVLDDTEAAKYVWGVGFHWYVGDHFENVSLVHDAYPDKQLVFTEGCAYSFSRDRIDEWHWGEQYGLSILKDLNNWTAGWVDWNILLDEQGGPNHVGNFCFAPIHADTKDGTLHYMNSYYYLGHFSKFIRPGAKRIIASSNDDRLLTTAFLNTDGRIAVVILNLTEDLIPLKLWTDGYSAPAESPARSIMTMVI
jgi:glucosylceramidase